MCASEGGVKHCQSLLLKSSVSTESSATDRCCNTLLMSPLPSREGVRGWG
ncbi:hypothetical protein GPEL0_01f3031 [Geoanaerobacter pelophilus]|uniref:Uncharacterized protein n=1 Tax=Geoanaerobacter pelophilus TaxID=60036 RepID=A0ABQ0MJQ7_9BACT|nr:hypothetical protein GPEL0_01f3031 [Geoanaerobacter pelophilus]